MNTIGTFTYEDPSDMEPGFNNFNKSGDMEPGFSPFSNDEVMAFCYRKHPGRSGTILMDCEEAYMSDPSRMADELKKMNRQERGGKALNVIDNLFEIGAGFFGKNKGRTNSQNQYPTSEYDYNIGAGIDRPDGSNKTWIWVGVIGMAILVGGYFVLTSQEGIKTK